MRQTRISTAAILIAIVASDLALIREMPALFLLVPFVAMTLVSLNLTLVQVLALRRPLGPFHIAFIGVGLVYGTATLGLRTHLLERLIAQYRSLTGDSTIWRFNSGNQIVFAEQVLMLFLGFLACLAGGVLVKYGKALAGPRSLANTVTS